MRILHVLDHSIPLHSGYTFRTIAILQEQRSRGWETFHLTGPKQGKSDLYDEQVEGNWHFFRTPSKGKFEGVPILNQLAVIQSLTKRLREVVRLVQPDILHAHSPSLNAIAALRVGQEFAIPLVYEVRAFWEDAAVDHGTSVEGGLRYRLSRMLETYAIRHADAVTTICEGLRTDIVARGIPAQKLTVIPNAVDAAQFDQSDKLTLNAQDIAARLGLREMIVLGFIGSFYAYEGLDLLLEAMPALVSAQPKIRLLLVGGGTQEQALKAQVERLGMSDFVFFTGRIPHSEVSYYYEIVQILVYPRHRMRLTELVTPLKPLEAMAKGKLVVASNVGGHQELIQDGQTGVLFEADNQDSLINRLLQLIAEPNKWAQLKIAARKFIENERTWKNSVARYEKIYGSLLGKRS